VTTFSRRQRGSTLIIALILLVLMTLFATSSLNTAKTNLTVVGNMQAATEATNISTQIVETVMSTPQFISTPANAIINPCGAPNTVCTDINGDGTTDYTTTLTPAPNCVKVQPIKNSELNLSNAEDLGCVAGQQQQFGVAGSSSGDSLCSYTIWEINAQTVGATTGADSTVVQGVGVRVSSDDASCS
jgi:Tfp pilus assembly protein PilX